MSPLRRFAPALVTLCSGCFLFGGPRPDDFDDGPDPLPCDGVLDSSAVTWEGLGDGFGHLRRRRVEVEAHGRRLPGARRRTVALPPTGSEPTEGGATGSGSTPDAPQNVG